MEIPTFNDIAVEGECIVCGKKKKCAEWWDKYGRKFLLCLDCGMIPEDCEKEIIQKLDEKFGKPERIVIMLGGWNNGGSES